MAFVVRGLNKSYPVRGGGWRSGISLTVGRADAGGDGGVRGGKSPAAPSADSIDMREVALATVMAG
jgi:hypothetical protein